MIIAAADIGASNTGLCLWDGTFRPSSWHPSEKGDGNGMDYQREGRRLREWRDFIWSWLVGKGVEVLGVENPLPSNITRTVKATERVPEHETGAAAMVTLYRTYNNTGAAIEIAERLNIGVRMMPNRMWFGAFTGIKTTPHRDDDGKLIRPKDRRAWRKKQVRKELERMGIKVRNNDQGDAAAMAFVLRGLLRLDGVSVRPGELLERAVA